MRLRSPAALVAVLAVVLVAGRLGVAASVHDTFFRTGQQIYDEVAENVLHGHGFTQAGDFRLLSRRAANALARMPERARFLRGMSAWIGYKQTGIPYKRDARYAGDTKYPARKMIRFAADAITSFSSAPLRFVSGLGLIFVVFCAGYLAYSLYSKFFTNDTVPGWTTVVVLVLLLGGIQLLSLGIVGTYVARIFEEAKARPLYLVDEVFEAGRVKSAEPEHPRGE